MVLEGSNAGNVGIGTSSPSYPLTVSGKISYNGAIGEGADNTLSSSSTTLILGESSTWQNLSLRTAGSERMRIDSSGNVGIGTSPDFPLHVSSTGVVLGLNATSGAVSQRFNENGTARFFLSTLNGSNGLAFVNGDGTSERMRIDSSGNVGIGTDSPNSYSSQTTLTINGSTYGRLDLESAGTLRASLFATAGSASLTTSTNVLSFDTSGGEAMRIDSSGNLLVGTTTTPTLAGLAVGSTTSGQGKNISVFSSANGSNGIIGVYQSNGTEEGQFYAGTGSVNIFGTSVVKVVAATGGVQLTSGATSWAAISDERLKDVIEPITNAAQKVSTLRAVIGRYKTDTEETRRSFLIAQDVQAVLPEAVDATNENELGIRYTETIPLLVAAIQEQQATIQTLTARIAALES